VQAGSRRLDGSLRCEKSVFLLSFLTRSLIAREVKSSRLLFLRAFVVGVAWRAVEGTESMFVFNGPADASEMGLVAGLGAEIGR